MHPMKKFAIIFNLVLVTAGLRAALPTPDLIAQIHFAGVQKIFTAKNVTAFTNEFGCAEALALRKQTADKLSVWLSGWLQKNTGATVADGAAKLRPLFDDLQKSEWYLDARAVANGKPTAAIAIKLGVDRAQLWQSTLKLFFATAIFEQTGGWLIFASDASAQKLADGLVQKVSANDTAWLSADVNWPRLAQWYPKLKELGLPETQFTVTAPDDNLWINGRFLFPENLSLQLEHWQVPTNTVHPPFVSFTAVRGFAAWLKSQPWSLPYALSPAPNQAFVWALPQVPYQTFLALPVADAASVLAQVYANLQTELNHQNAAGKFLAPLSVEQTGNQISLMGMPPFLSPYIQAVREPAGQFLLAGGFPNIRRGGPLPADLSQRLAQKNLLFYHWEITAERLPQALNFSQLGLLMTVRRQLEGESTALKWIQKVSPAMGNNVTEIFQTGSAEMTFTRKSVGGFTALELLALGNWLEAPNFPGCDLKFTLQKKNRRPQPAPAAVTTPLPAK